MTKILLGGLAALLLLASAVLWMLRPGSQRVEGSVAPNFSLLDSSGKTHQLSDYAGRWLVLYFYPRDDSPICTREACRFRDDMGILTDLNAAVAGISTDDAKSHENFSNKFKLPFPLLSDPDGQTALAYESLLNLGVIKLARRRTFIISPDGHIAARFDKIDPATHVQDVARTLRALQQAT